MSTFDMGEYITEQTASLKVWLDEDPVTATKTISQALGLLAVHGGYQEPSDMWLTSGTASHG